MAKSRVGIAAGESYYRGVEQDDQPGPSASAQFGRSKREGIKLTFRIAKMYLCSIDKTIDFSQSFVIALSWLVIGRKNLRSRYFNHFFCSC